MVTCMCFKFTTKNVCHVSSLMKCEKQWRVKNSNYIDNICECFSISCCCNLTHLESSDDNIPLVNEFCDTNRYRKYCLKFAHQISCDVSCNNSNRKDGDFKINFFREIPIYSLCVVILAVYKLLQLCSRNICRIINRSPGRRRSQQIALVSQFLMVLVLFSLLTLIGGCSSRATPRPRPSDPPIRPNVTFQTYACPAAYATWYCLNGATCFTVKIGESLLYNCECADGYIGQRCEFKVLDGTYLPSREKVMLETASIAGGAVVAIVLVVLITVIFYVYMDHRRKLRLFSKSSLLSPREADSRTFAVCIHRPICSSQPKTWNFVTSTQSNSLSTVHFYHQNPAP